MSFFFSGTQNIYFYQFTLIFSNKYYFISVKLQKRHKSQIYTLCVNLNIHSTQTYSILCKYKYYFGCD